MAKTVIDLGAVMGLSSTIVSAKNTIGNVKSSFYSIRCQVDGRVLNRNNIGNRFSSISSQLSNIEYRVLNIKNTVESSANHYRRADALVSSWKNAVVGKISERGNPGNGTGDFAVSQDSEQSSKKEKVNEKNTDGFFLWSWKDIWKLISSVGIIGSMLSAIGSSITGGVSASKGLNTAKGVAKVIENIAKAVPKSSNTSFDWKTLWGLNSTITKDTPTSFSKALGERVEKLKFGNAKTVSDKVAVGAKWAGYGLTTITTVYDNFTDASENNSTGRKVAESIGETAVKIGEGLLIGAGVTAAFAAASVSAPVVVVGAVTVGVTWAVDKVCEAVTGKDVAEFVSDTVLDTGKQAVKVIGNAAKKVTGAVSGWWKKAFG